MLATSSQMTGGCFFPVQLLGCDAVFLRKVFGKNIAGKADQKLNYINGFELALKPAADFREVVCKPHGATDGDPLSVCKYPGRLQLKYMHLVRGTQ